MHVRTNVDLNSGPFFSTFPSYSPPLRPMSLNVVQIRSRIANICLTEHFQQSQLRAENEKFLLPRTANQQAPDGEKLHGDALDYAVLDIFQLTD